MRVKLNRLIRGGSFTNKNGTIKFINGFSLKGFERFYQIDLPKKNIIRAYHGHMKESKAVFVISGSILLCIVRMTNSKIPSKKIKVKRIILRSSLPQIYLVPPKYANGIMSLEKNTKVFFFSDKTLQESKKDDFRFDENYWGNIWQK